MNKKQDIFKEKFKQALISTAKVISDDYKFEIKNTNKNLSSKNINFFEIDNLSNKSDFVRLRAKTDSMALKKNFLIKKHITKIFQIIFLVDRSIILLKRLDMKF